MKKRKFGLLITSVLAAGAVLAACGEDEDTKNNGGSASEGTNSEETFSIAMVTDVGGIDDKSFNQSAWEGIEKFGKDNGLKKGNGGYDYLQSESDADYNQNLNNLIRRDFDLVFGVGFMMGDAISEIAAENPDKWLAIIDSEVKADNVASILFKEQEGGFLAGVVAASMSKSGKIGFIGGNDIPVINRFHAAGGTGNGVFSEAKERKAADKDANVWVIGVDADQYAEGQVDANTNITLTSMLKGVGSAVIDISNKAKNGEFPGGTTTVYGLAEDGVGLADSRGAIPDDVLKLVDEYSKKIVDGEIKVPETKPE